MVEHSKTKSLRMVCTRILSFLLWEKVLSAQQGHTATVGASTRKRQSIWSLSTCKHPKQCECGGNHQQHIGEAGQQKFKAAEREGDGGKEGTMGLSPNRP